MARLSGTLTRIGGLDQLAISLKALPKQIARSAVHAGLKKAAAPIVTEARARAPKADHVITRKNHKGKRVTIQPGEGAASIKARVDPRSKNPRVIIGPDAAHFYLQFAETGFTVSLSGEHDKYLNRWYRRRGIKSPVGKFIPPRPWLKPAFENHSTAVLNKIGKDLGIQIERAAAKVYRHNTPKR